MFCDKLFLSKLLLCCSIWLKISYRNQYLFQNIDSRVNLVSNKRNTETYYILAQSIIFYKIAFGMLTFNIPIAIL